MNKTEPSILTRLICVMLLLIAPSSLLAQEAPEDIPEEVDRILREIEAEDQDEQVAAEDAEAETEARADEPDPIRIVETGDVPGLELRSTEDTISITLDNVVLADVVRIFARFSGANITNYQNLDEQVSATLNDVKWRDALQAILEDKGYALAERRPGIYSVVPRDQLASEPLVRERLELKYITVEQAMPAVEGMLASTNARVIPLPAANSIIVVDQRDNITDIREALEGVDRPREQVFIEAKFVELNDSAIKELGIDWQVLGGYTISAANLTRTYTRTDSRLDQDAQGSVNFSNQFRTQDSTTVVDRVDPTNTTSLLTTNNTSTQGRFDALVQGRNFSEFDAAQGTIETVPVMDRSVARSAVMTASDFALTLSALQQLNGVRIVSNPKMLVANGQTATIHVGTNEPNIRAIPQGDTGRAFAYVLDGFIEIGVKLEVTPIISTAQNITVSIIPELSRLVGERVVGEAQTSFPITQVRRINTEFAIESGKTVAIGGLTQGDEREVVRKVPLLGDLPLIGKYLFRYTRTQQEQDEVIIFVSVDMAHVGDLDDRFGVPDKGRLIHTWLQHEEAAKAAAESR